MMAKLVPLMILLAIGLSGSHLIKGGLYFAGIDPNPVWAYWILGLVCFASILYFLFAIKRLRRGRNTLSIVAEPCVGFLVLLLCCNAWGLAFREAVPAVKTALPIFWVLSAAGMLLTLGLVRTAKRIDSTPANSEPDSCQNA
jgi:hypothetical protein